MRHGLVGEESGLALQFEKTLHAQRPIELLKEKEETGVDRIGRFIQTTEDTFVAGETAIGEIESRHIAFIDVRVQVGRSREKQNVGV